MADTFVVIVICFGGESAVIWFDQLIGLVGSIGGVVVCHIWLSRRSGVGIIIIFNRAVSSDNAR